MSLINLNESFLYERLPFAVIELDERYLIQSVISGTQDRFEDLRSYARKFDLFFGPAGLPETGPNVVLVDLVTSGGKAFTRSIDITASTPTDSTQLAAWAAHELALDASGVSNARLGSDPLRLVDASILDFLASNLGAILYKSAIAENQPDIITQSGTYSATQLAHQRLIETYFPRLKFKGTARSFGALGKLLGFDDVRVAALWGRVSPRLPNDPGSSVNDPDFTEIPEFWPQQEIGPFYDPLNQSDGPFYAWTGVVSNGTATTNFYTQRVNGFQPWVNVDVLHGASGTVTHPESGTYVLAGGAPHQKALVAAGTDLQFMALGEGDSWNGITVKVSAYGDGTLRRLDINDRLSSIKYRTSYYDLGITMDADKADATFGVQTSRANKDIAPLPGQTTPQGYLSYSGVLYGTSPFRPFTGGTATFQRATDDFLTPFAGAVVTYIERREAGLGDHQQNFDALASAGQGVTQALEEVRPATRSPRRASYGYLQKDAVGYAPIQAEEPFAIVASGSQLYQSSGTLMAAPLPPYAVQVVFRGTATDYLLGAETLASDPTSVYFHLQEPGTVLGRMVLSGVDTGSFGFTIGTFREAGTLVAGFFGTIGHNNLPDSHEVARSEPYVGQQILAAVTDYGFAGSIPGAEQDVADLLHSWLPDTILTIGDNDQLGGGGAAFVAAMAPYNADILAGKIFPIAGNHDDDVSAGAVLREYFFNGTAPGNGRYYNVRRGNVELFGLNTGWTTAQEGSAVDNPSYAPTTESDGTSFTSVQGQWLKEALARSTAQWKLVYVHEPPFVSSTTFGSYHPGYPRLRWPFREWGATIVLSGHVHAYERLLIDEFPYIIVGNGGYTLRAFTNIVNVPGSQVRWPVYPDFGDFMALKVTASNEFIRFDAITRAGYLVDSYRIDAASKRYMTRPEDQLDDDLVLETMDEYPYRRDIVGGGELIEMDFSTGAAGDTSILEQTMAVKDQSGAEQNVYVIKSALYGPRFVIQARSTTDYRPGQRGIAFRGQFRDQASLGPDDLDLYARTGGRTRYFHSDLDNVFQAGYALYHAGVVNGVLVADADKFSGASHSRGLAGWLPFNEHPDDDLTATDAALPSAQQTLVGVRPEHREFDAGQGRYLHLKAGANLMSSAARECYDEFAISFWIKCESAADLEDEFAVNFGGVRFNVDLNTKLIAGNVLDADGSTWHPVANASATDWVFVYLRKTATAATFGSGNLTVPSTETVLTGNFLSNTGEDLLVVAGAERAGLFIRDLRIWNVSKTAAEMDLVRNYQPTPTLVPYRIGHVLALNDGDRFGLQVLSNGWLAPSNMPAWVRTPKFARAVKYNGDGEFVGEPWRKEVGLGGGQIPPSTWQLGYQYHSLTAAGTLVVAPAFGVTPGVNAAWLQDATNTPGKYTVLTGMTPTGFTASTADSGTSSPWPNPMVATNPVVDQIWLTDDDGHVYLCKLEADPNYGARFVAAPGTLSNQEQGDALSLLAGMNQALGVTGYGSVVQKPYGSALVTPPLYMYLHDVLLEEVGGGATLGRWTDPTSFGIKHGYPALKSNGELSFTNTATLLAGIYKLRLDVGNIGKADVEFDGFRLDITIGDLTVNRTLLSGFTGSDFRSQQEVEFTLDHDIVGDWLLTLSWLNAFNDAVHGTARQLIVYGYTLRRLETNLFEVSLAVSGTTPVLTRFPDLHAPNWEAVPGGWLVAFNSYGTIFSTAHEGTVYPSNDTLPRSRYPLANLLTGRTADRREDVTFTGTNVLLTDPADPVIAPFGDGLSVT